MFERLYRFENLHFKILGAYKSDKDIIKYFPGDLYHYDHNEI